MSSDQINAIITQAESIYCQTGEPLSILSGTARSDAVKFCAANEVPPDRIAREFGLSIEWVNQICRD